jgi:acyl carrier protein
MMQEQAVRDWVIAYLADLVDLPPEEITADTPFKDYSVDSADAIIMGGSLEDHFNVEVDAALFLRNETLDALITDLRDEGLLEAAA